MSPWCLPWSEYPHFPSSASSPSSTLASLVLAAWQKLFKATTTFPELTASTQERPLSYLPACEFKFSCFTSVSFLIAVTSAPTPMMVTPLQGSSIASEPRVPPTRPLVLSPLWPLELRGVEAPGPVPTPRTTCPGPSTRSPSPCHPALGTQLSSSSWSSMRTPQLCVKYSHFHTLSPLHCREVVTATVSTRPCVLARAAPCTTSPPRCRCSCSTWRRQTSPERMTDQTSSLSKSTELNNARRKIHNNPGIFGTVDTSWTHRKRYIYIERNHTTPPYPVNPRCVSMSELNASHFNSAN